MKLIVSLLLILSFIQAQDFTKADLLGSWEISSKKLNRTVSFGKYIGKERNGVLHLLFNPQGQLKLVETGDVYNYEVENGQLKMYEIKVYRNDYRVKSKKYYDLLKIKGEFEGCHVVRIVKKKMPGYKSKYDYKMCKISNYPQATYQENISKYKF